MLLWLLKITPDFFYFLKFSDTEVFLILRLATFRCAPYSLPDFVYRSCLRWAFLRSASKLTNHFVLFLSELDAVRFLLWWLFLHRRLRSRQRGSFCNERLLLTFWWFLAKKCFSFLSEKLEMSCDFSQAKPFGFDPRCNSNFFPSNVTLKSVCHHSACLSLYRSKSRRCFWL